MGATTQRPSAERSALGRRAPTSHRGPTGAGRAASRPLPRPRPRRHRRYVRRLKNLHRIATRYDRRARTFSPPSASPRLYPLDVRPEPEAGCRPLTGDVGPLTTMRSARYAGGRLRRQPLPHQATEQAVANGPTRWRPAVRRGHGNANLRPSTKGRGNLQDGAGTYACSLRSRPRWDRRHLVRTSRRRSRPRWDRRPLVRRSTSDRQRVHRPASEDGVMRRPCRWRWKGAQRR